MEFEKLYDGIDTRVVEKLNPSNHGWIDMPATWHTRFKAAVEDNWRESPSSVVSYIQCPMKWLLERYLIEEEKSGVEEVRFHAILGSIVHRILEVFYNEPNGYRSEERLNAIIEALWKELINGTRTGVVDKRLLEEWQLYLLQQTEGEDMPSNFVRRGFVEVIEEMQEEVDLRLDNIYDIDPNPDNIDVLATETWCRTRKNGIQINGKIDRIVGDGKTDTEIIQDYKTGRTPFGDPDVNLLEDAFVPCGLYALMRSTIDTNNFTETGVVNAVELLYLKESAIYELEIGPAELDLASDLLEAVTREMQFSLEKGQIKLCPADTSDSDVPCKFCPVSGLCPAFSDGDSEPFSELKEELPYLWEEPFEEEESE